MNYFYVLLMIGLAVFFGIKGQSVEMGLIIVAGAIGIAFLNMDKFQSFKGAGFEATMKEARAIVEEAHASLDQLKEVASTSAEMSLTLLMASNFFSGMPVKDKLLSHAKMIKQLKDIGASDEQINISEKMWRKGVCLIYFRGIEKKLRELTKTSQHNGDAISLFGSNYDYYNKWESPTTRQIEIFFESQDINIDEVNEILDEYKHYEENNEIKDIAKFCAY